MSEVSKDDLRWAAQNGDLDKLKNLLSVPGVDIEQNLSKGQCLMHVAADYGQTDCIEYLIGKGAKLDRVDENGITPILNAIWEGHTKVVKLLIEKGAKTDGKSPGGESYIDCAEKEEIKALLK